MANKQNIYTLDNVLLSAIATAHRNSLDNDFHLRTYYKENDIRRFLSFFDREDFFLNLKRSNNNKRLTNREYKILCAETGQTFLDEFIQPNELFSSDSLFDNESQNLDTLDFSDRYAMYGIDIDEDVMAS